MVSRSDGWVAGSSTAAISRRCSPTMVRAFVCAPPPKARRFAARSRSPPTASGACDSGSHSRWVSPKERAGAPGDPRRRGGIRRPARRIATWPGGAAASPYGPAGDHHLYDDREEVLLEFVERGYYYRPPLRDVGRWAVLRFNAITPGCPGRWGSARPRPRLGGTRALLPRTSALLDERRTQPIPRPATGGDPRRPELEHGLEPGVGRAVHAGSPCWVSHRFGGFIVWQMDTWFHAILATHVGTALSRERTLTPPSAARQRRECSPRSAAA